MNRQPKEGSIEALFGKPAYYASDREYLIAIYYQQEKLERKMSDMTDLVAAVNTKLSQLGTDLTTGLNDLEADIVAAGGNSADVQAGLAGLKSIGDTLSSMDAQVLAADATTKPAPPPAPAT